MRLIDADALIEKVEKLETYVVNDYEWCLEDRITVNLEQVENLIEEAPTVEERPRGEWISVEDRLPEENVAVLIWSGSISIAKLEKGITMAEREAMKRGEIDDTESEGWNLSDGWFWVKRSDAIRSCDEWGNNLKPYCWEAVGGVGQHFGQDVKYWMPLPQKPDMRGEGDKKYD